MFQHYKKCLETRKENLCCLRILQFELDQVIFSNKLQEGEALEEIEDENKSILWALLKQVSMCKQSWNKLSFYIYLFKVIYQLSSVFQTIAAIITIIAGFEGY